jgi:serine protease Do
VVVDPAAENIPSLAPSGTGFFIDENGTIVTSSILVGQDGTAHVNWDGIDFPAKAIGTDDRTGMAVLQIDLHNTPHLTMGTSGDLKTGHAVIAVGYPLNLAPTATPGLISGFDIRYLDRYFPTTFIHASISISPGELGGPLLRANGTVAGLIVNTPDSDRTIYVLPADAMQKVLADLIKYGHVEQGWVGIIVDESTDARDRHTVKVKSLAVGTPASTSGILAGDTVLKIDNREIFHPADVMDASFFSHPGDTMSVMVQRDNEVHTFSFVLTQRP